MKIVTFLAGQSLHFDLLSYFIHKCCWVCRLKKKRTLTKPFIEFLFFKINFFVFVQENRPNTVEFHMYKVTKMERTLPQL